MNTLETIPQPDGHVVERTLERTIFAMRWLLVPFYVGLFGALLLLLIVFGQRVGDLATTVWTAEAVDIKLGVLVLIDLCLMANLIVIIIFAGYESFVSRFDIGSERLEWMGRIGLGDLKLRLVVSLVAISAIHLLEDFMDVGHVPDRDLVWRLAIHGAFVVSGLLLACMDRIADAGR
jgi:uncharacterized protein (TIGR00645 family)